MTSLHMRPGIAALCASVALACATPRPDSIEEAEPIRLGARFELGRVVDAAGAPPGIDSTALLREALASAISKAGLRWAGDPAQDHYVLDAEIVRYQPGNAFKRWLLPGYGATILRVRGQLVDPRKKVTAARIDHQRSVLFGGAYTIGAWQSIFDSVASEIAHELAQHARGEGFFITLEPWASRDVAVPAASVRGAFTIGEFVDRRSDRGRIGERQAAFDVSMGEIHSSRDVAEFLREAVADELRAAGHSVVEPGAGKQISGEVLKFWVRTDTTPLYWDLVGEIELRLSVGAAGASGDARAVSHRCEQTERTWVWPTKSLVAKVVNACLDDLMQRIREDPTWLASRSLPRGEARAR